MYGGLPVCMMLWASGHSCVCHVRLNTPSSGDGFGDHAADCLDDQDVFGFMDARFE